MTRKEEKEKISMDITSFQTRNTLYADVVDLGKKRKLLLVELDLPEAKYKCVELEGNCDTMSHQVAGAALTNDGEHIFDTSQVESVKDSNNITDDSDTATSVFVDANYGFGHSMGKDIASTSAKWPDCDYPQGMLFSSDGTKEPISESSGQNSDVVLGCHGESSHECELQRHQMFEDQLAEFGVDLTYGCPDYANVYQECRANEEAEDCNFLSGFGSTNYILSSGRSSVNNGKSHCPPSLVRSSVNNEPLNSTKRPTIDKEFEEYFTMLMM